MFIFLQIKASISRKPSHFLWLLLSSFLVQGDNSLKENLIHLCWFISLAGRFCVVDSRAMPWNEFSSKEDDEDRESLTEGHDADTKAQTKGKAKHIHAETERTKMNCPHTHAHTHTLGHIYPVSLSTEWTSQTFLSSSQWGQPTWPLGVSNMPFTQPDSRGSSESVQQGMYSKRQLQYKLPTRVQNIISSFSATCHTSTKPIIYIHMDLLLA